VERHEQESRKIVERGVLGKEPGLYRGTIRASSRRGPRTKEGDLESSFSTRTENGKSRNKGRDRSGEKSKRIAISLD